MWEGKTRGGNRSPGPGNKFTLCRRQEAASGRGPVRTHGRAFAVLRVLGRLPTRTAKCLMAVKVFMSTEKSPFSVGSELQEHWVCPHASPKTLQELLSL